MTSPTQSAMEQQQREAFKAWAQSKGMNVQRVSDDYLYTETKGAWLGWIGHTESPEIRSLRDSLALAKADVRRYQWLRDRLAIEDIERLERDFWGTPDEAESAKTDAAIDAALNKEQP